MPRHFLRDDDLSPAEQAAVLDLADAPASAAGADVLATDVRMSMGQES
jgi:ornithine carbamoyltransferase